MIAACEQCHHWMRISTPGVGECRAAPPAVVVLVTPVRDSDEDIDYWWPRTNANEFCGAFRPAAEKEDE